MNRKLTRRGRKNRELLKMECKTLSVGELVNYMERNKAVLRKLKKGFVRRKKVGESRFFNRTYQVDPSRVYKGFNEFARDQGTDRPVYKSMEDVDKGSNTDELLDNIEEASGFWKELWETPGSGNASASWLEEMKDVIREHVPPPAEEEWDLEIDEVVKTVKKKKNWSAPGPDKISSYWWKHAEALHHGVMLCFKYISKLQGDFPAWFTGGKTTLIPKPGVVSSDNQRPITCLNTVYKWFTACLFRPMDQHLDVYGLI